MPTEHQILESRFQKGIRHLCERQIQDKGTIQEIMNDDIIPALKAGVNPDRMKLSYKHNGGSKVAVLDRLMRFAISDENYADALTTIIRGAPTMKVDGQRPHLDNFNPLKFLNELEYELRKRNKSLGNWVYQVVEALVEHPLANPVEVEHVRTYPASVRIAVAAKVGLVVKDMPPAPGPIGGGAQ